MSKIAFPVKLLLLGLFVLMSTTLATFIYIKATQKPQPTVSSTEGHSCVYKKKQLPDYSELSSGVFTETVDGISKGGAHTCFIENSNVYCSGLNYFGQSGHSKKNHKNLTVVRNLPNSVSAISAGGNHTCASNFSKIYCWGYNSSGQLGDDSTQNKHTPTVVKGLPSGKIQSFSAGGNHTCALINNKAWCWGSNFYGQIGNDSHQNQTRPVLLSLPSPVTAISAGGNHTCAIAAEKVYCWGYNKRGQMGIGSTQDVSVPTLVKSFKGTPVLLSAGGSSTCATSEIGLQCWGSNENKQFGTDSQKIFLTPMIVKKAALPILQIATGGADLCWSSPTSTKCLGKGQKE